MNKEYTNDKDDAVSQSVNITLNALKHGPVQLAAVFADLLQQNSNLIKKNELLEKMVESSKHIHDDEKLDNVFTQHLHEEHPNLEQDFHSNDIITEKNGNVKSRELHTNNVCNKLKDLHSSLNLQATFKNENHLKHQTLCRSSQSIEIPEKKEKVGYLSKTMVPHPLFGCYCDVCQKLLLNPNVEVYKLEASRDGHLISRNCLVVLKEDLLATVLYVGHRRCYKGFVNERFCKEERPLGVTVNISGLDKEAFISLKDIEYLLEFKPPIPTLKREPKFPPRKDHLNCNLNRREGNRNCNSKPDSLNIIPSCVVDEDTTDGKEHLRSCFHRPTYLHSEKRLPSNSTVREKRPLFQHTLTLGDREGVLCRQCHSASDLYEKRQTEGKESRCYWPKSGDHLFQRRSSTPSQEEMLKRLSSCIDSNHVSGRRKSDTIDSTTSLGFDESFTFGLCKYNEIAAHSPSINSGKCFDALKRQVRSALYSEEPSICCQHALPRYRSNNQHCY